MTFHYNNYNNNKTSNGFNSKIMLSAIFSLSFVILIVIILHIYARCALRPPPRHLVHSHRVQRVDAVPNRTGLDPTVINSLPSFMFKQFDGQDQNECAVCLSMLENDELARRLPNCNHIFHMACIDTWLSGQSTCPVCRADVMPRLGLLNRESPMGGRFEAVVAISGSGHQQGVVGKAIIGNGSGNGEASSSSSYTLNSFRKIIGRERSFSSRRIQVNEELDLERQGQ